MILFCEASRFKSPKFEELTQHFTHNPHLVGRLLIVVAVGSFQSARVNEHFFIADVGFSGPGAAVASVRIGAIT